MIFWYFKYVKKDLWRKILTENFDSRDEHCFYIKLNTAIILVLCKKRTRDNHLCKNV